MAVKVDNLLPFHEMGSKHACKILIPNIVMTPTSKTIPATKMTRVMTASRICTWGELGVPVARVGRYLTGGGESGE